MQQINFLPYLNYNKMLLHEYTTSAFKNFLNILLGILFQAMIDSAYNDNLLATIILPFP